MIENMEASDDVCGPVEAWDAFSLSKSVAIGDMRETFMAGFIAGRTGAMPRPEPYVRPASQKAGANPGPQ